VSELQITFTNNTSSMVRVYSLPLGETNPWGDPIEKAVNVTSWSYDEPLSVYARWYTMAN
jgi:hypothetical protein